MARTYTKLIYHLVFSTKERIPLIAPEIRDRLYEYLGGVIRGEKGSLMEIGGMPDHVHILARFGAAIAVSEMLKRIKGSSSHWLSQQTGTWFAWQSGYGAFSVSESQVAAVRKYIQRQEEHHKRISFKDELISLLRSTGSNSTRATSWIEPDSDRLVREGRDLHFREGGGRAPCGRRRVATGFNPW